MQFRVLAVLVGLASAMACSQSDFGDPLPPEEQPPGPGTAAWGDEDVSCATEADCSTGEVCERGVCQVKRCASQDFSSTAPLGDVYTFARDQELLVMDGQTSSGAFWIDGYAPTATGVSYQGDGAGSLQLSGSAGVVDLVAADFTGQRPDRVAVARAGTTRVEIVGGPGVVQFDVGAQPIALGAGDTDGDQHAELVALFADGRVAVCQVYPASCTRTMIMSDQEPVDLAVADVDGDGLAEVAVMGDGGKLAIYDLDAHTIATASKDSHVIRLAAADLDGDGKDELLALENEGWAGLASDTLHVYGVRPGVIDTHASINLTRDVIDVAAGTMTVDGVVTVAALRDGGEVDLWTVSGLASMSLRGTAELTATNAPRRLVLGDKDGDSPRGKLVEGPTLVPGSVIPTTVIYLPPYDALHARGNASVTLGDSTSTSESFTDTVSLSASVDFGAQFNFPIFSAKLSTSVSRQL
jgi:hypothetical protein